MQKLMTKAIEKAVPALYETDGQGENAIVQAHYFSCFTGWDWYMTEYDPETKTAYGLVKGFENELGYFSIAEFEDLNHSRGIEIVERDLYFTPQPLRNFMESEG